ncbi:MAG: hypothetical protein EOM06_11500, partial [Sphingobacteriia bacterium]|nr:hypothetical protein [Sphingobacteriia bacterium]
MSRFYGNHLKKLALLTVMLVFGLTTAYAQQTVLKLSIECEGIVLVRDQNTQQAVASIQGPTAPGDFAEVGLAANQLIQLVTDGPAAVPPVPQFQIQGVEVEWWAYTNNHVAGVTPTWTYQDPATTQNLALQMGSTGTQRIIEVRFKIKDPGVTIDTDGDISTVTNTPVIIPVQVTYPSFGSPNPYAGSDIYVNAMIEYNGTGTFPAGAQIIKVSLNGGTTNLITSPYSVAGKSTVYLSEVLGITPAFLEDEENKTLNWEITVDGVSTAVTVPVKVSTIAYKVIDPNTQTFPGNYTISGDEINCITEFEGAVEFNVTWADSQVADVAHMVFCSPDCIEFDYAITYPSIVNLDTRIMNDAKITIFTDDTKTVTWTLNAGATINVTYNSTPLPSYTVTSSTDELLLSTIVANNTSLMGHSGTDTWGFEICGANPGNYFVVVENFVTIDDNWPTPLTEYVYDGDEFLIQYVGASDVTFDPITVSPISTATNAPVIFDVTVNYPDWNLQNLDPALLADNLILFDPALPAGAEIVEILYDGGVVSFADGAIGGVTYVYLSDIIGSPAPTLLSGHSASDTWTFTIVGIDTPGTYTATINAITYLPAETCYSVMDDTELVLHVNDLTIEPIDDIHSVTSTPVIIPVDVQYPEITPYNSEILVDAKISAATSKAVFPAETYVIDVRINGTPIGTVTDPYDISGKTDFLLSDMLGLAPGVFVNETNKHLFWEITVISHTSGIIDAKIESIVYADPAAAYGTITLAEEAFSLTYAPVIIDEIDDITVCHPDDIVFGWCETYPLVENIDQGTASPTFARIFNDGKFSFYSDAGLTTPVSLTSGTTITLLTPAGHTKTSVLGVDASVIYGSAIVAEQIDPTTNANGYLLPLEPRSGTVTNCWTITIEGAVPGTIFVKFESIALLNYDGHTIIGGGHGFYNSGTTFEEFIYEDQDWKVIYVGADGVTLGIEPNAIETVTGAPVVFDVEVAYGDLASQNIDPSVLVDALILFDTPLPVGAEIVELLYNGGNVGMVSPTLIGGVTNVLLSDIIGQPAAVLAGHNNLTDTWTLTVAGVDEAGTYTATIQSIAYIDYKVCHSVMAEDEIVVTWEDMCVSGEYMERYCLGDDVEGVEFYVTYPAISNNPAAITTDALLSVNNPFPAGSVISWTYTDSNSGVAQGTYTVPSPTPITEIRLSEIVGGSAPT